MSERPQVILKSGRERSVLRFHPWIFSGGIERVVGKVAEGDTVDVISAAKEFLGVGHFYDQSLSVRLFAFAPVADESEFWTQRLADAIKLRSDLKLIGNPETTMFRLINGEGDGFPGLVVDLYGQTAVMQCHTPGIYRQRLFLAEQLQQLLSLSGVYDKSAAALRRTYPDFCKTLNLENDWLVGSAGESFGIENGFRFQIDWVNGQKTGFFLDQRENRRLLMQYSAGQKVLNCFSYTGGFSVFAFAGGAESVTSVDSSQPALDLASAHVAEHFPQAQHQAVCIDCRDFLQKTSEKYSCIVLDPPPFARSHKALKPALRAYQELNQLALNKLSPGGFLFTFSCSQPISGADFWEAVSRAAVNSRRKVRVISRLHAGPDHPQSIFHPEGEYLKGLLLAVG